ncbi:hypothetical protein BDR06DRAFT_391541 [Suillus hirtellus]|nr:hypothetical protein BDR06DRAFT_391541 [Suillus hirtellus]
MLGIALSPDGKKMVGGCLEGAVGHTYAKSLQNGRDPKQCGLSARSWPALVASRLHDETARQGDVDSKRKVTVVCTPDTTMFVVAGYHPSSPYNYNESQVKSGSGMRRLVFCPAWTPTLIDSGSVDY